MENIDKIKCILIDFEIADKTLDEAANEILRLFDVSNSVCLHELQYQSYNRDTGLQICDKCGAITN